MLPAAKPPTALLLAGLSLIAVLACTWLAFSLQLNFASAGFLYLFLIVVTALYGGFWVATLSSVVAVACLNYFFVPPVFSFTVTRPENWVALGAFEFTALTISRLSHRAHSRAAEAIAERSDSQHLYETAQRILALDRSGEPGTPIPPVIREVFALSGVALFDARICPHLHRRSPTARTPRSVRAAPITSTPTISTRPPQPGSACFASAPPPWARLP